MSVKYSTKISHQSGVALMEVLITMVVIAFGLLALLSLQTKTMLSATQSNQYYLATASAQEIGERIRANVEKYNDYNMSDFGRASISCDGVCLEDLTQWHDNLAGPDGGTVPRNGISGFQGKVDISTLGGIDVAVISVRWLESDAVDADDFYTYTLRMPLNRNIL